MDTLPAQSDLRSFGTIHEEVFIVNIDELCRAVVSDGGQCRATTKYGD